MLMPCADACRTLPGDWSLVQHTRFQILHWLRTSLWFWPLVCIATGIAVSVASVAIDRAFDGELVPRWLTGGPEAALEILGTIAGSMVSLTALVLTVVLVVIQLGMGQFSPRIVAEILQDKPSQFAIGIFVGTFAHAMLALSQVSTAEGVLTSSSPGSPSWWPSRSSSSASWCWSSTRTTSGASSAPHR